MTGDVVAFNQVQCCTPCAPCNPAFTLNTEILIESRLSLSHHPLALLPPARSRSGAPFPLAPLPPCTGPVLHHALPRDECARVHPLSLPLRLTQVKLLNTREGFPTTALREINVRALSRGSGEGYARKGEVLTCGSGGGGFHRGETSLVAALYFGQRLSFIFARESAPLHACGRSGLAGVNGV
jgi:hypothetical protein